MARRSQEAQRTSPDEFGKKEEAGHLYREDQILLGNAYTEKIKAAYPSLEVISGQMLDTYFDTTALPLSQLPNFKKDFYFSKLNPHGAPEHTTARLDNYQPQNQSQTDLLKSAQHLVHFQESEPIGLYVQGDPGLGKSHIGVGVYKDVLTGGYFSERLPNILYWNREGITLPLSEFIKYPMPTNRLLVVDDLGPETKHGAMVREFTEAVLNIFQRGGKLFVTSNYSLEEVCKVIYYNQAEKERFLDRLGSFMKFIKLEGQTYRKANNPWGTSINFNLT